MPTLRRCSPLVIVCDITVIVLYIRLKCQLSGDVLHGSRSLLIKFCLVDPNPISVIHEPPEEPENDRTIKIRSSGDLFAQKVLKPEPRLYYTGSC